MIQTIEFDYIESDKTFVDSDVSFKSNEESPNQSDSGPTVAPNSDLRCNCNCDKSVTTDQSSGETMVDESLEVANTVSVDKDQTKTKIPTIFVITPTYSRPTQMADMTRLSQTLSLVDKIFWIVSEDSHIKSQ